MKYHKGECEICKHSKPKPLDHITFICEADTGGKYGYMGNYVTKNNKAVRRCRWFEPDETEKIKSDKKLFEAIQKARRNGSKSKPYEPLV